MACVCRNYHVFYYLMVCSCRNYHVFYCLMTCAYRNYHVFYYLMVGSSEEQRERLGITKPEDFHYLNQVGRITF